VKGKKQKSHMESSLWRENVLYDPEFTGKADLEYVKGKTS